ncbi:MAG: enoyl-CoA hydratase/isomerase family protein, partial [Ilumatobacteraceae bacterium]
MPRVPEFIPGCSDWETGAMTLLICDVTDGVALLTLNAPDTRNTMTLPMVDEIVATMDALEDDETVHAVIVTGAGSAFCAGADLGNLQTATEESLN